MAASPKQPILPSPEAAALPQQLKDLADELWEEIFLRVASPSDLARASTACSSFRRLIADPTFLRRHRSIHPPLVGLIISHRDRFRFQPVEAPHPNAPAASALAAAAGFTFDYLPHGPWGPFDVRDGRLLLGRPPQGKKDGYWFPDLTVCDPLSRRSLLLPRVPGDLISSAAEKKRCFLPALLPCGHEEEDTSSFRVISTMYCVEKLVVFIFSSSSGCWNIGKSTTWDALGLAIPIPPGRNIVPLSLHSDYACGCVYWKLLGMNKLLQFNINSLEFCTVDFPLDHNMTTKPVIVETAEARLGMFNVTSNQESLYYATRQNGGLRSNEWKTEDIISLPEGYRFLIAGALGGYIILLASPVTRPHSAYFSLEVKTMKIERIGRAERCNGRIYPYIGFPPSISPRGHEMCSLASR
ncbi:hypothetical protein SEVIR_2G359800v4 [Setaria viridis]